MKKKLLVVLSLLIIGGLFAYFAYIGGAFLRLTPVTGKQFEQAALTLGFTKAAVDKSAISDKTGQLMFCHSTGRITDSNIKFVVLRR